MRFHGVFQYEDQKESLSIFITHNIIFLKIAEVLEKFQDTYRP